MKMSENKPIQLGLCCLNSTLRTQTPAVFSSRKMIIRTIQEKGIDTLKQKIIENLKDTIKLIDWNEMNGIKVFRLSSELFPHKSNKKVDDYSFDFAIPLLKEMGNRARLFNQRITFHPGQYNVVGTPNIECFKQTISDLKYHADVLDIMEMDHNSVMVVHGGGVYGDKTLTKQRWCRQFELLPENVKKRLVIENCEKCFSIEDCLEISQEINIPEKYNIEIDIMVEAKKKELAIFKLYEKYPSLNCLKIDKIIHKPCPLLKKKRKKRLIIVGV